MTHGGIAADPQQATKDFWSNLAKERALEKEKEFQEEVSRQLAEHPRWGAGVLWSPFTMKEVREAIASLPNRKASGPDHIPNEALKRLPDDAIEFLALLFNSALHQEMLPQEWRQGSVVLLPKSGADSQLPGSYRPITLLSNVRKLLELLFLNRLKCKPNFSTCLDEHQAGFRAQRSCPQQARAAHSAATRPAAADPALRSPSGHREGV